MQDFTYKMLDKESIVIMAYEGDDEEVTIPFWGSATPVRVIADDIFKGHKELKKINLPESLTDIGGFVFDGCDNLKTVQLPNGLRDMWQYAFARSGIEEIDIPTTVRSIVPFTFKDCKQLHTVTLHEGTIKINAWAFQGCENLKRITVYEGTEINPKAFEGCSEDLEINTLSI